MDKTHTYKRKNYFVEKKFQGNFILKFCGLVAAGGALTIALMYYVSSKSTTVAIVDSRVVVRSTADFLLPVLIQTVLVVTVIVGLATIVVTLFISHKLAGPLHHFKKSIKSMEEGDFSTDFRLRQLDQLHDLADTFNTMIKKMRQELNSIKSHFVSLKEKISSISEQEVSEHKRQALSELKRISEEADKIMKFFKT